MVAQPIPASTPTVNKDKWIRALERAKRGGVVAYRSPHPGVYFCSSASTPGAEHTVVSSGPRWWELECTCPGGRHEVCMHRAVVAFCRKYHVYAVRPTAIENASTKQFRSQVEQREEVAA
jgi:hypothetical protein